MDLIPTSSNTNDWARDNLSMIVVYLLFLIGAPFQFLTSLFGYYDVVWFLIMGLELLPPDATSWVNVMNKGVSVYGPT